MWNELKNKTDFLWHNGNTSLGVISEQPLVSFTTAQSNGSTPTPHPTHTDVPLDRGSGIIPGGIAAAVFISFLLALYAVLWKCMVTPPRRKEKKKRRVRLREQRSQVC
ncbi:hypothetical protein MATL_G00059880 [Megalops atlanticus]|uniref:Uncharacterized protein n=1 Tax=Megalops atlanticus TaxID=7932 RepID=A0A9D3QBA7_MEGAT|nr:hypothetical protein MATL_G00059880 [Megalops atlanticus]